MFELSTKPFEVTNFTVSVNDNEGSPSGPLTDVSPDI